MSRLSIIFPSFPEIVFGIWMRGSFFQQVPERLERRYCNATHQWSKLEQKARAPATSTVLE
jgi:hypothetical protein